MSSRIPDWFIKSSTRSIEIFFFPMQTRSGCVLAEEPSAKRLRRTKSAFLTCGMIRGFDDSSPEICGICRKKFLTKALHTFLLQCPTCKHVYHSNCMSSYILASVENAKCPHCRADIPYEMVDGYVDMNSLDEIWAFDLNESADAEDESEDESEESESDGEDSESEESGEESERQRKSESEEESESA